MTKGYGNIFVTIIDRYAFSVINLQKKCFLFIGNHTGIDLGELFYMKKTRINTFNTKIGFADGVNPFADCTIQRFQLGIHKVKSLLYKFSFKHEEVGVHHIHVTVMELNHGILSGSQKFSITNVEGFIWESTDIRKFPVPLHVLINMT